MLAPHISSECFQLFYPAHKLALRLQIWALSWPTDQRSWRRFGRSRETGGGCLGCNRGIGNSPIPPESLLLSVGCCLMNLCPENGIYLGTRGAAAALQCFLVPLKSPELAKASWAAAQRILITNGPKLLLGAVCCSSLSDCGLQGKEWPCDPPYLHQLLVTCCSYPSASPISNPATFSLCYSASVQFKASLFLEAYVCFIA